MSEKSSTIYMPLLNEGTPVWRPVQDRALAANQYLVTDCEPEDEEWAFAGSVVVVDADMRIVAKAGM